VYGTPHVYDHAAVALQGPSENEFQGPGTTYVSRFIFEWSLPSCACHLTCDQVTTSTPPRTIPYCIGSGQPTPQPRGQLQRQEMPVLVPTPSDDRENLSISGTTTVLVTLVTSEDAPIIGSFLKWASPNEACRWGSRTACDLTSEHFIQPLSTPLRKIKMIQFTVHMA